ncbi:hypothetical protein ZWY2020_027000 [Hordeum vulgare]|nr:hypothetical protein ZWY2020_027000 [Hordeum vulgare]
MECAIGGWGGRDRRRRDRVRIARIFTTYGPRMCIDDGRVVRNFVAQALRKEPLTVYGDGKQTRSFQYVSDLYINPNVAVRSWRKPKCKPAGDEHHHIPYLPTRSEPRIAGGGTSIRKYVGALKDSTTVSIAKVNSDYKQLDIAIVKATNHVERPAKEKYIRGLGAWPSCIAASPRLQDAKNRAVALKTLIVIHRALREVDPSFRDELISNGRSSGQMLHMSYFKDDSSPDGTS